MDPLECMGSGVSDDSLVYMDVSRSGSTYLLAPLFAGSIHAKIDGLLFWYLEVSTVKCLG